MANRNKEIKDVVDLRSLKHKKFLSEWGTWVNGTYNVRKKTIDNNTTVEFGRKVVANNNETANKVQIDQLKVDKADKTEVMKKDVDGSYTALLTTDKVSPMVANQTGFPQNGLYSAAIDFKNINKVLINGYNRNMFYTEDLGNTFVSLGLNELPESIQIEVFNFDGIISVDSDVIKAFAFRYDSVYGTTRIYKTLDLKNWIYDYSLPRIDGVGKIFIKDRRVFFHIGAATYSWVTEPYLSLRSRSIDEENGTWLTHWNIAHDRTTHDIPRPQVDKYGADGIRFSTFAKYNGKIYDVLFYDRNSYFSPSPNPDSYQIWVKPIDGNSICVINIGHKFNSVYSGSAIVKGDYLYIFVSQGYYLNQSSIYRVNLITGESELVRELTYNSLKYTDINSDENYFYLKQESGFHYLKMSFDGSNIIQIKLYTENNTEVKAHMNSYGWCGQQYYVSKINNDICIFNYNNEKLTLFKRLNNPSPSADIVSTDFTNNGFLITDNFNNKRFSIDNGKSWTNSSISIPYDPWLINFDSEDGVFLKGDKLTWTGLILKHMRGSTVINQFSFDKINDYCIKTYTYLNPDVKSIWSAYVGKNGKILVNFLYKNLANTLSYDSWYFYDNFEEMQNTDIANSAPVLFVGEGGKNYGFGYIKSYFDSYKKALINDMAYAFLVNFELKTMKSVRSSVSYGHLENTLSNESNVLVQQNEFSGRMNSKDIVVLYNDETYVQVKLPFLPANVKINRKMKYIEGKFFLFYSNGMAYYAEEYDLINSAQTAFKNIPTDILGKLNDISFNGTFWLAVGDKGIFRVSTDLINWFGYDITRYNTPDSNMFGFDITKANLKPTTSIDFKIEGSSKMSLDKTYKTLKTINGVEGQIIKTETDGIDENVQSNVSDYWELTLNNVDVKYEKMEYSGTYNAIAGTSVKVCRIPYNWRGKRIVVEFEARKTNSTVNALASFCYDGTSVVIKECKQNKDNATWVKYLGTIILPSNWDKTRPKNGEKFHTDVNTTIVGAFIDIGVANGNWDIKNIKVTFGEVSRPLQFATDSSECHLFNVPEAWRGCELEITYDLYNKGGERGTSIDVFNGTGVSNWIVRGGEDIGLVAGKSITKNGYLPYYVDTTAAINNSFKDLLYKSPKVGATFFTRSLNSNVNTLGFFEQNSFTIDSLSGKTLNDLTYFDFGISGDGNIIVGSSGIEFKNFKAKIKSIENTFDFFETGGVTFGDTSKFTFEELMTEKNIK